jgi:molecular chaperone DnaK
MKGELLLGIDFGTSTNYVTKYDFAKKDAVAVANMGDYGGSNIFENTIYIESDSNVILGQSANKKGASDPMNFFRDIKRHISSDNWSQKISHRDNQIFTAQDIATLIFKEIKTKVEKIENRPIDGVVLTVPYSYGDQYRRRLRESAQNAGLIVVNIIEEPIAAAVSFGLFNDNSIVKDEKILVFDFGGGTLDITVFNFSKLNQSHVEIEVLNTSGVKQLGGKDIDEIMISKFKSIVGVDYDDISNDVELKKYQEDLNKLASEQKEILSNEGSTDIYENFSFNNVIKELEFDLSVDKFNQWLKLNNIIGKIEDALDQALWDIGEDGLEPEDIDKIILAGGSSSIPIINETITNYFNKTPIAQNNLGELVGRGAGIVAGISSDDSLNYDIIKKVSKNVGISQGNKFISILSKNTNYGIESDFYEIKINNLTDTNIKINFYEGDTSTIEDCEYIGHLEFDTVDVNSSEILITLSKDTDDGRIIYKLYDDKKTILESGHIENKKG